MKADNWYILGALGVVAFAVWFIYYKDKKDQQVIEGLKMAAAPKRAVETSLVGRDDDQYVMTTRPEYDDNMFGLTPASGGNSAFTTVLGFA